MIGLPLFHPRPNPKDDFIAISEESENGRTYTVHFNELCITMKTSSIEELETGGAIWHAGYSLAQYLFNNPYIVRGKSVVELGCGCGLVGLVAACVGAQSVCLTDLPTQERLVNENIMLNESRFKELKSVVYWKSLPFGECFDVQADVVLGADIAYDLSLHPLIIKTLKSISFNSKGAIAYLAEEIRWKDIYGWYVDALRDEFGNINKLEENIEIPEHMKKTRCSIEVISCIMSHVPAEIDSDLPFNEKTA